MKKFIIILLSVSLLITGCGYVPTPTNNNEYPNENNEDEEEENDDEDKSGDWWEDNQRDNNDEDDWDDESSEDEESSSNSIDYWGFANSNLDTNIGVEGYYIDKADYERLIRNLAETEKERMLRLWEDVWYNTYNVENTCEENYWPWQGSCFGMVMTSALVNFGVYEAKGFGGVKSLYNSLENINNFSAINFYMWQQCLAVCRDANYKFQQYSGKKQNAYMIAYAEKQIPFAVSLDWYSKDDKDYHGHEIMIYGVEYESGEKDVNGNKFTYNAKLLTYDCNAPSDTSGDYTLYLNINGGSWCYPTYGLISQTNQIIEGSTTDNAKFGGVLCGDQINTVDYRTGELSETYRELMNKETVATVQISTGQACTISSSSGKADINGLIVSNSTYDNNVATSVISYGEGSEIEVYIPQNESYYNISSDEDLVFGFDVGNYYVSVDVDSPGEFEFNSDGSMELKCDEKPTDCNIRITSDDDNSFGIENCNTFEISGSESKDLTITPDTTGIIIDGDDISNLKINGEMYGKVTEIDAGTSSTSVKLTKKSDNINILADTDNDGKFEDTVSTTEIPENDVAITLKNKSVTYNGKTQNIDKATVSGTDNEDIIYVYYTDKTCTTEATSHKNVGTYYVQALKLNECGTFYRSNVAKLTIKQSKQNIVLKTKTYTFKSSDLQKKSRTANLKVTAKGTLSYKKLSGNSKISVSKKGVITAKKGLSKGVYKVKIKAVAKATTNYKKTSKNFVFNVRVK